MLPLVLMLTLLVVRAPAGDSSPQGSAELISATALDEPCGFARHIAKQQPWVGPEDCGALL